MSKSIACSIQDTIKFAGQDKYLKSGCGGDAGRAVTPDVGGGETHLDRFLGTSLMKTITTRQVPAH